MITKGLGLQMTKVGPSETSGSVILSRLGGGMCGAVVVRFVFALSCQPRPLSLFLGVRCPATSHYYGSVHMLVVTQGAMHAAPVPVPDDCVTMYAVFCFSCSESPTLFSIGRDICDSTLQVCWYVVT
jgi:hypothetical protein